ncbi:MAG: ribonucleotide-diphosphate reductase subunit alpha, partial [Deltaproteobacteria bacterium]|nr:ribonucleotide-diphosphate reductase subunit alpha [Deltaproteobacteria bacterium]
YGRRYLRNATVTTIAPTGTLSIIAGCSSGIEPLFAVAYRRRLLDDQELVEIHPAFRRVAKALGFWNDDLARRLVESGSIRDLEDIPAPVRSLFVTAYDLDPLWHLQIQSAFQEYTDNAVSKTVNLPRTATLETVREIFLKADELCLNGVNVYRDGS